MNSAGMFLRRRRHLMFTLVSAALLPALLAGCVGYRVGSTVPRELRSIHVPTFVNRTGEPMLEADATAAVIRELQTDGTLKVVGSGDGADLLLNVVLVSYELEPVRYERDDTQTTKEYRLRIEVDVECVRRSSGALFSAGRIHGESTFVPSGGLASSKKNALPAATRDLSYRIVQSIVQAW